ncbi:hypothetical protein K3495_g17074, partial [Podosphaera aphanis]
MLTASTFNEWYVGCRSALAILGARGILEGTETRPTNTNAQRVWDEKAREILKVIIGSCSLTYKELCTDYAESLDVKGLWDKLTSINPSRNEQFTSTTLRNFHLTQFDPKRERIIDVINRLKNFQVQLASTEDKLTDRNILRQLIHSLPQNDAYWKIQGTHILTNHLSLEAATLHLQSCEDSSTD